MFKLLHNCTHFICWQSNPQNSPMRLQQYVNWELPDVQAGFRKGRGIRDQIANICRVIEKAREFQKNLSVCFIDYAKAFDSVDHNKLWKILKEKGIPDHLTCLLRNLYAGQEATVRNGHGCLFTLLIVSFAVQKLLSFIRSHLFIFAFVSNILGCGS